jgi:hypothetical protein
MYHGTNSARGLDVVESPVKCQCIQPDTPCCAVLLAGLVLNATLLTQILVFGNKGVAPKKAKPAVKKA